MLVPDWSRPITTDSVHWRGQICWWSQYIQKLLFIVIILHPGYQHILLFWEYKRKMQNDLTSLRVPKRMNFRKTSKGGGRSFSIQKYMLQIWTFIMDFFGRFPKQICNIIFRKWGGGQRPFGIFPKIHLFWGHQPSLTFDIVPASPEARAECEAFCLNWYSMYFGMNVPNPMNANTKKMVDPKLAMNSLLPRSLFRAGKNASFVLPLSPFNSY